MILHLGHSISWLQFKLREEWLKSSPAGRDMRMLLSSKFYMGQQRSFTAQRTKCILEYTKHCMTSWEKEGIILLYLVQPHLQHCVQFWAPQFEEWELFNTSRGHWWKGWRENLVGTSCGLWLCLVCNKGVWRAMIKILNRTDPKLTSDRLPTWYNTIHHYEDIKRNFIIYKYI